MKTDYARILEMEQELREKDATIHSLNFALQSAEQTITEMIEAIENLQNYINL